jgi:hypothetical protein
MERCGTRVREPTGRPGRVGVAGGRGPKSQHIRTPDWPDVPRPFSASNVPPARSFRSRRPQSSRRLESGHRVASHSSHGHFPQSSEKRAIVACRSNGGSDARNTAVSSRRLEVCISCRRTDANWKGVAWLATGDATSSASFASTNSMKSDELRHGAGRHRMLSALG